MKWRRLSCADRIRGKRTGTAPEVRVLDDNPAAQSNRARMPAHPSREKPLDEDSLFASSSQLTAAESRADMNHDGESASSQFESGNGCIKPRQHESRRRLSHRRPATAVIINSGAHGAGPRNV